jgi:hypothetical protein
VFRRAEKAEKPKKPPLGLVDQALDAVDVDARLLAAGEAGELARRLDAAVATTMAGLRSLSALSSPLALNYLERVQHPMAALDLGTGVFVVTRGYAGQLAVEADAYAYGAVDVPVLGTLPEPRRGRPPADLLNRVVRATRRGFPAICAVSPAVWESFVLLTVVRVHEREGAGDAEGRHVDPVLVDGLARLGWVLRQADLHYGMRPELDEA